MQEPLSRNPLEEVLSKPRKPQLSALVVFTFTVSRQMRTQTPLPSSFANLYFNLNSSQAQINQKKLLSGERRRENMNKYVLNVTLYLFLSFNPHIPVRLI